MFDPEEYPDEEKGDFISGIFNYCDRWCERCPMTMKCRQFAMEATMEALDGIPESGEDGRRGDRDNAEFWKQFDGRVDNAPDLIGSSEDWDAAPLDSGNEDEARERHADEAVRRHPTTIESMGYLDRIDPWIEANRAMLENRGVDLSRPAPVPGAEPQTETQVLNECLEVILWYHMQIHVKLSRALGSQCREREELADYADDSGWPSDADGSAKVALRGIDRSLSAWGMLRERLPEKEEEIFEIMLQLDRIRRLAERQFPDARAFKRPGFDR